MGQNKSYEKVVIYAVEEEDIMEVIENVMKKVLESSVMDSEKKKENETSQQTIPGLQPYAQATAAAKRKAKRMELKQKKEKKNDDQNRKNGANDEAISRNNFLKDTKVPVTFKFLMKKIQVKTTLMKTVRLILKQSYPLGQ